MPHLSRLVAAAAVAAMVPLAAMAASPVKIQSYKVPAGAHPHDVAPAPDGSVWYTAQHQEALGRLDPATGETRHIFLGDGSRPHGVIVGPEGHAWITDGGLNAMVRVDARTERVDVFRLPADTGYANLNTAAFDNNGIVWFTGQSGIYGRVDPASGEVTVFRAAQGRGPYGISATRDGRIFYASLAGSHIAEINTVSGEATVIEPPTPSQGARRVWPDSTGRVWVSEWNSGQLSAYTPDTGAWQTWKLPGDRPKTYAVYVDETDVIWLSDFGANAVMRFDPKTERFESFVSPRNGARVRQLLGRDGEVWAPESGTDTLVVYRYGQ
jgi:virginiamycin B lyase